MAHPFTAVPLGFSVMGQDTLWWGGCAWDSFAIPHLLPRAGGRWWWPRPALGAAEPMRGRWIIESLPPEITLLTS